MNALLTDRLLVAYDIAEAMDYLHQRPCPIIFRDLKPNNIGFAADGVLKLFDFGLAKELMSDEQDEDGLYRMTKLTGNESSFSFFCQFFFDTMRSLQNFLPLSA